MTFLHIIVSFPFQAKNIHLHPELFTVENDLLTPTFKSKRPALRKHFAKVMEHLYAEAQSSR